MVDVFPISWEFSFFHEKLGCKLTVLGQIILLFRQNDPHRFEAILRVIFCVIFWLFLLF